MTVPDIAALLPSRSLNVQREALIEAIVEQITLFGEIGPQVKLWRAKISWLIPLVDRTKKSVTRAHAWLQQMGLEKEIEEAIAARKWLDPSNAKVPIGGASPMIDLHFALERMRTELERWERLHRPAKHRPRAPGVALTERLQELCRKRAGLSKVEFDNFLEGLNALAILPKLTVASVTQRRSRKAQSTKHPGNSR